MEDNLGSIINDFFHSTSLWNVIVKIWPLLIILLLILIYPYIKKEIDIRKNLTNQNITICPKCASPVKKKLLISKDDWYFVCSNKSGCDFKELVEWK